MVDLESVRARLDIALKLYQSKTMQKQRAQAALEAEASGNPEEVKEFVDPLAMYSDDEIANFMRELYRGLLGGRKFHYQIKLAINRGIDILKDPMLGSMVHALQLASFLAIKKKTRIQIPEACTLIGVCDETGLLEENEVFV